MRNLKSLKLDPSIHKIISGINDINNTSGTVIYQRKINMICKAIRYTGLSCPQPDLSKINLKTLKGIYGSYCQEFYKLEQEGILV